MQKKTMLTIGATAFVAASLSLSAYAAKGILFPDWSQPGKGTWDAPAAEAGKKLPEDQPWTVTTMASSIMGKPVRGKTVSMVGEIIDISCYLQVGKHGDKHRDCGQKCARNGQPVGLLTKNGDVYILMDEEHDPRRDGLTTFRQFAVDNMGYIVRINGTNTEVEKQRAIYVTGFLKQ